MLELILSGIKNHSPFVQYRGCLEQLLTHVTLRREVPGKTGHIPGHYGALLPIAPI